MNRSTKIVLVGMGLLAGHLVLRSYRKKEPTLHLVDSIPGNFNAATIPPFGIYIAKEHANNSQLLNHELVHWQQYQRMGLVPFYSTYFKQLLFHGYDLHPMEQEARKNEAEYCRTNYTECVRSGLAVTINNPDFRKIT